MSFANITNINDAKVGATLAAFHQSLNSTNRGTVNTARSGGSDNEGWIDGDEIKSVLTSDLPSFALSEGLAQRIWLNQRYTMTKYKIQTQYRQNFGLGFLGRTKVSIVATVFQSSSLKRGPFFGTDPTPRTAATLDVTITRLT
jgi:hypothetical protein